MNNNQQNKNNNYYIQPDDLKNALIESQKQGKCTEELGNFILTLNKAVMNFPKFRFLPQEIKDEIISYSNYRLLKRGIFSANPENPKLFSYFTTAISINALQRKIWLEKKIKEKSEYERMIYKERGYNFVDYSDFYKDEQNNI